MSNSPSKGTAPVTGASRGIGAGYADLLAKRGYDLILVARSDGPLKALTASRARASGRHITPILADLNDKAGLAKVGTELKNDPSITMLVNNAGTGSVAPMLDANIEKMEQMIALNITALTRLPRTYFGSTCCTAPSSLISVFSSPLHLGRINLSLQAQFLQRAVHRWKELLDPV